MKTKSAPSYLGALTPISPDIRPLRIVGFDTEDNSKGRPLSFAFHDGKSHFYTTSAAEAIDFIYDQDTVTCFVAHNLEYDIENLFKGCNYKYIKEMVYSSKLLHVSLYGTKHFFINSSSFFQGPLKKMGELVGLPKLEGDPLNPAYNIRDAHIPQIFTSRMQERCNALGINLGISIGQMAMSAYRRNFLKGKFLTYNHPGVLKAYYGGRVEMFYKGVLRGGVHVADINSSYPDVMWRHAYPDGAHIEPSTLATHEFGVGHFRVHVPTGIFVPPLPLRSETGRLFFPTGTFEGDYTYAEMRMALSMGASILHEDKGHGTNFAVFPFRDFVTHFWEKREPLREKKDSESLFESLFLKLLMNNLYGKFSQHKPSQKLLRTRLTAFQMEKQKIPMEGERKIGPFFGYTIPRTNAPKTANYLWGVYITSYARISLLEKILRVQNAGSRLVYCDTDSIMFTGDEGLSALTFGKSLGEMSLESFGLGVMRTAKGYLLCNRRSEPKFFSSKGCLFMEGRPIGATPRKEFRPLEPAPSSEFIIKKVACKGVPTSHALPFLRDGFVEDLRKPVRLKEGLIRMYAEANKEKSSAFMRKVSPNFWGDVEKKMQGIYIKRRGEEGVTQPLDAADIPAAEKSFKQDPPPLQGLEGLHIRDVKKKDPFIGIKIPRGWFRRHGKISADEKFFEAQDIHYLKQNELLDLPAGSTWFRGKFISKKSAKYGNYFVVYVKNFLGDDATRKKFLAAIPEKFFDSIPEEKIMGKDVEIILASKYIPESSPELTANIR